MMNVPTCSLVKLFYRINGRTYDTGIKYRHGNIPLNHNLDRVVLFLVFSEKRRGGRCR
jgi:hypothetical protein